MIWDSDPSSQSPFAAQGNRITPSYVAFTDDERLIGEAAKNQATINPTQIPGSNEAFKGRESHFIHCDLRLRPM